jgi:hypothetical protein
MAITICSGILCSCVWIKKNQSLKFLIDSDERRMCFFSIFAQLNVVLK